MSAMADTYDIAIVGAGMAGASLAASLGTKGGRVVLLEAEDQPGFHATGRSAAFWTESYGGRGVQPLTTASGPWLRENGFLRPRGALTIAKPAQHEMLEGFATSLAEMGVTAERLDRAGIEALVPGLLAGWSAGVLEPSCCDIDVAALHHHYLAQARQTGADVLPRARLVDAERLPGGWRLRLSDQRALRATVLVNAAGAWADAIARLAGVRPLGIVPLRRTMVQLRVKPAVPAGLPLVLDIAGGFYFKPESGRLWLSPHDETPSPACDAAAEEIDIATAIARLQEVVGWRVERVERAWAGLRSFAADRLPVYGFDPRERGFFWCAGQGGFGIQTAPAAAALASALLLGREPDGIDPARYVPDRFDRGGAASA